jgi:hypothetical protein
MELGLLRGVPDGPAIFIAGSILLQRRIYHERENFGQ